MSTDEARGHTACAQLAAALARAVADLARATGRTEQMVRVSLGLLPPAPTPHALHLCQACGRTFDDPDDAAACRDYDYQR